MKLTFERKLPLVLFFVFLMLVSIGVLSYQYTVSLQEAFRREKLSQDIYFRVDRILTNILDSDSMVLGFFQTGNSTYEDHFDARKRAIVIDLTELRGLAANIHGDQASIWNLEKAVNQYWTAADARIDRRKELGTAALAEEASWIDQRTAIGRIRSELDSVRLSEQTAAANYSKELDSDLFRTIWILIAAGIAGVLSLAVANVLVWNEGRRRAVAESALVDANHDLEEKVKIRTNELKMANEQLHDAAAEREKILANEQAARMEAEVANRLRDEFMATVSHELRTPLNSILGWARMLRGGTLDDRQAEKAVNTIIKNSETQNRLIEDLLDVARLISGKLELDMTPLSLNEVIGHSIDSVRPAAENKSIVLQSPVATDDFSVKIVGDSNRLQQVFTNLLTNSIKFTPEGGSIDVSIVANNGYVHVEIKDTGVGISKEFLPIVFERFRQDTTAEARKSGLGLGLAIVRNLVEMHGGNVNAESEGENKGSKFTVKLPIRNALA